MGLADALKGLAAGKDDGDGKKTPIAVSVSASPVTVESGAQKWLKASAAHDAEGMADAFRIMFHACSDEQADMGKGDDDEAPDSGGY